MYRTKVGQIRKQLAKILEFHFDCIIDPALLRQNYDDYWHGRAYGFSFSWYYDTRDRTHPLHDIGSGMRMKDIIQHTQKDGYKLVIVTGQIFAVK